MAVVGSNAPLPEPKPTRQWDAWTREEEESFFGALRQVGKNFEKITSRVQSKNKDQVLWTPLPVRQPEQHKAPARVRHYYYRVIKRMNRILAPTLILDAKNSASVNSAMLRWWALLEKHSCSASKLRLKPRRFKTFVTALEHQLLKDHKKVKPKKVTPAAATSRRQTPHAETTGGISTGLPGLVTNGSGVGRTSADDLQNSQLGGPGRKKAVKRKASSDGPRKSLPKGEAKRPPRPRKKATDGNRSKAAIAKWEKEASVGVSLMAEAAEHLERATAAEVVSPASEASKIHSASSNGVNLINVDVQTGQISPTTSAAFAELGLSDKITTEFPTGPPVGTLGLDGPMSFGLSGIPSTSQAACVSAAMPILAPASKRVVPKIYEGAPEGLVIIPELCSQVKAKSLTLDGTRCNNCNTLRCNGPDEAANSTAGAKLKLQLFPFDDYIRKALEQDGHNPHLELTFKGRKSISSVLHHLVQKWGRSTVASGDLRLFPFNTQWSNVSTCQSWSFQDLNVSAADVHAALGNPSIFRLRYVWLSGRVVEPSSAVLQQQQQQLQASNGSGPVSFEGACYHPPRSDSATQQISVVLQDSITRSVRVGKSTGKSKDQHRSSEKIQMLLVSEAACRNEDVRVGKSTGKSKDQYRPSEQTQILPVSEGACRNEDVRHVPQSALPVHTISGADVQCAVPCEESIQTPSSPPVTESEQLVVAKSSCSSGTPAVPVGLRPGKESAQPALSEASFAHKGAENVVRPNCKELDHLSQVSGCAWLCESNDGFAQQLWNAEDTLRSNGGVSISQMEWVDSLTNISVSELLGEASRPVFTASSDTLRPSSGQAQLNSVDSFDMAIAGQGLPLPGPMLVPSSHPSTAIFGGEDTCDAFSFQNRRTKETVNSLGEEVSGNPLSVDITFADFRSMACWREGDSLVAFDLAQQPQHRQDQDLLFDGEASMGLGGLIEALAQGSVDGFQACTVSHDAEDRDIDQEMRQDGEDGGQIKASNAEGRSELSSKDGSGRVTSASFLDLARIDELSNGHGDLFGLFERLPDATLPNITLPSQDMESLKVTRPVNNRVPRKKERRPPQRPFKLPDQYSTPRSLKLQG